MKLHLSQFAAAAVTLALCLALGNNTLRQTVYDSALSGGAILAGATLSVGNLGQPGTHPDAVNH